MASEEHILLKQMDVDGDPQQDKLIHNLRFIRIAKMLRKRLPEDSRFNLGNLIDIVLADPTTHIRKDQLLPGKYSEWMAKQFLRDLQEGYPQRFWEDLDKMSSDLVKFHDLKTRGKISEEKRDILHIASREDLFDLVEDKENKIVLDGFPDFRHLLQNGDAVLIHASSRFNVYALISYAASREIGAGTQWCTVCRESTFSSYSKQSFLYVVFVKKKDTVEKYQIHFSTDQYRDIKDRIHTMDGILVGDVRRDMIQFAIEENDPFALIYFGEMETISHNQFRKLVGALSSETYLCGYKIRQFIEKLINSNRGRAMISSLSPAEIDNLFYKNCTLIERIDSPTREMKIAAVKGHPRYIGRFRELLQEEDVIMDIMREDSSIISYISKPSKTLQLFALNIGGFEHIKNPLPEVRLKALERDWKNLKYIKNQTSEEIKIAMKKNADAIMFVERPSSRMQVNAVLRNASLISCFEFPCHEAQIAAIEANFSLINSIKHPTEEAKRRAAILHKEAEKKAKLAINAEPKKKRWKDLPREERIKLMIKRQAA